MIHRWGKPLGISVGLLQNCKCLCILISFSQNIFGKYLRRALRVLLLEQIHPECPDFQPPSKWPLKRANPSATPPPPRSGHRNCRNVPERFARTL